MLVFGVFLGSALWWLILSEGITLFRKKINQKVMTWINRFGGFDEDYGFQKLLNNIDALIIGRKTYEVATTVSDPYPGKSFIYWGKLSTLKCTSC